MMHDDEQPRLPQNVYFQFFNEIGIISQLGSAFMEALLPPGFLISHFSVLNHLTRVCDGRTPLEIARAFQVPKTTMTHTLSGLERHGLVQLRPNPKDGRSKQVWLTDAGRQFHLEAIRNLDPQFAKLNEAFRPDEIAGILPLLVRIREYLDAMRNGE